MPRYEVGVKVTPELAKRLIDRNFENNRNIKPRKILQYSRDMAAGRWRSDTAELIKVAADGTLLDGQNRMHAVIKSGGGRDGYITFDFAHDVPVDAIIVMDSGASRTYADAQKVRETSERMRNSAIVRWVLNYENGIPMNSGMNAGRGSAELDERWAEDPGMFDAATSRAIDASKKGLGAVGPVGTAFCLFAMTGSVEMAHRFFDQLISGAHLPDKHPTIVLRDRLGRIRMDRITRQETLALYIRAWNFWRRDELPERLLIAKGDLDNSNFPKPI